MKNLNVKAFSFLALLLLPLLSQAEVFVIVNEGVSDTVVSKELATDLFLGKTQQLSSGTKVKPVDQEAGEDVRDEFYTKVVNKTPSQLKAYWSGLIFTGKGMPPNALLDDEEVAEFVAANPSAIGYVSDASSLSGVKVVFSLP